MRLYATASHGTEPAVRDELRELRFRGVRAERGGVAFEGDLREAMRACFELRCPMRILVFVAAFDCPDERALYDAVRALDLSPWLDPKGTLAVRVALRDSRLRHSQFVAQKTKDAIVDRIRDALGFRPSVDKEDPDTGFFLHLVKDRAELWVDASGDPLHARGYRVGTGGEAPLKETLAASLLRIGGWDRERPLVDPMCGSGTFGIEGLLWARRIAPGLLRGEDPGFGYRNWPSYGQAELDFDRELEGEARARILPEGPAVLLADRSADAVALARENIREAGLAGIRYEVQSFEITLSDAPERPFVITNPPYGERLDVDEALYADLGSALRGAAGARFAVLAGSRELAMAMRLRWDTEQPVKNGQLLVGLVAGDIADAGATMRRDEAPSPPGPRRRRV